MSEQVQAAPQKKRRNSRRVKRMVKRIVKWIFWLCVLAAAALNTLFFASVPAAAGMAVMLGGDTAAALIGRKWGRHKMVNGKSFEGFAGFFITGLLLILLLLNIYGIFSLKSTGFAVAAVLAGDLAELFEKNLHIDDNFSIALVVGGIMQLSLLF